MPHRRKSLPVNAIDVSVRIRPMERLRKGGGPTAVEGALTASGGKFAHVFPSDVSQSAVYTRCGAPLVDALLSGYDGCLFAYGQTGSGKTHSMLGAEGGHKRLDGIVPQVASELFRQVKRQERDASALLGKNNLSSFGVSATYVEVWKERAYDLLSTEGRKTLTIREEKPTADGPGFAYAVGAQEEVVRNTRGLLDLIRLGSTRRATASTGMNEHSSRSHAVLTLSLEHRWREERAGERKGDDGTGYRSRTTRLTLVDLAGSESTADAHDGAADAAGCAINKGLLALGQVCSALAEKQDHVPYRTSMLTRLLQSSLGGRCRTHLLACISDSEARVFESERTLQFGSRVGGLTTAGGRAAVRAVAAPDDPMRGDKDDDDEQFQRRARVIETSSHGDVFCRVAGPADAPLLLYVHGSGPRTTSLQWNTIVHHLTRMSPHPFYHVAIDCPGYGRSAGDKQTVRSYPGDLIADIVRSLGKTKAYALLGSSQGCCSVFNAVLEHPDICSFIIVKDPVGHDVSRYSRISQPTMLVFDEEDLGHPITVGRRMNKNLQRPHWFEYKYSKQPDWEEENFGREAIRMIHDRCVEDSKIPKPSSRKAAANSDTLPDLSRVAGGVSCWMTAHGREHPEWAELWDEPSARPTRSASSVGSARHRFIEEDKTDEGSTDVASDWVGTLDHRTNRVQYSNTVTGEVTLVRPPGVHVRVAGSGGAGLDGEGCVSEPAPLFHDAEHEARVAQRQRAASDERRVAELLQTDCDKCGKALLMKPCPVRYTKCRHVVCECCWEQTTRYTRRCGVCAGTVSATSAKARDEELQHSLAESKSWESDKAQEDRLAAIVAARSAGRRVVLEFGNTSSAASGKSDQKSFLRVVGEQVRIGSAARVATRPPGSVVAKVDININPSYPKPTAVVKSATKPWGFALDRTHNFTYSSFFTVHWHEKLGLAPLHIRYFTQMENKVFACRIVVDLPDDTAPRRIAKGTVIDYNGELLDGWVQYTSSVDANVSYICPPSD